VSKFTPVPLSVTENSTVTVSAVAEASNPCDGVENRIIGGVSSVFMVVVVGGVVSVVVGSVVVDGCVVVVAVVVLFPGCTGVAVSGVVVLVSSCGSSPHPAVISKRATARVVIEDR
jgi:hypothetical protein